MYFEVLELVCGEVERRFDQTDFRTMQHLELLLVNAANGEVPIPDESLLKYLEGDINKDHLFVQLSMVADMIQSAFKETPICIKSVTNV